MKCVNVILVVLVSTMLLIQCTSQPTPPPVDIPEQDRELTQYEKKLVSSGNSFGLKLFKQINSVDSDKNIFISPLSVAMALGMTYNGANGTTQEAMQQTSRITGNVASGS